jgi:hypothetical protein
VDIAGSLVSDHSANGKGLGDSVVEFKFSIFNLLGCFFDQISSIVIETGG